MPLHCSCMVDPTSLIWSVRNLCRFIVRAWLTLPALYGVSVIFAASLFVHGWPYQPYMERQDTKTDMFAIHSTCMEISVSLSCLFVHEPPYQTTVVCCNPVFHRGRSCMDHPTVFTRFPRKCGARSGSPQ